MKAYCVDDYNGNEGSIIVFAENRGKAKAIAFDKTDKFCDYGWNELRAIRYPLLDALYNGRAVVEWFDDTEITRILVKEYGWHCYDTENYGLCRTCELNSDCEYYKEAVECGEVGE